MRTLRVGFNWWAVGANGSWVNIVDDTLYEIGFFDFEAIFIVLACRIRKNALADFGIPNYNSLTRNVEDIGAVVGDIDYDLSKGKAFNFPLTFKDDARATDFILRYGNDYRILDDDLNVITEGPAK